MVSKTKAYKAAPLATPDQVVLPEWIDSNGHMNIAYYSLVFDRALNPLLAKLGLGPNGFDAATGGVFTVEAHLSYVREVRIGNTLRTTIQLLHLDEKRFHIIESMYNAEERYLAATCEQLCLHVDLGRRKSSPFPKRAHRELASIYASHRELPVPESVGKKIRVRDL